MSSVLRDNLARILRLTANGKTMDKVMAEITANREQRDQRERELVEALEWALGEADVTHMDEYTHDKSKRWYCGECKGVGEISTSVAHTEKCPYGIALATYERAKETLLSRNAMEPKEGGR